MHNAFTINCCSKSSLILLCITTIWQQWYSWWPSMKKTEQSAYMLAHPKSTIFIISYSMNVQFQNINTIFCLNEWNSIWMIFTQCFCNPRFQPLIIMDGHQFGNNLPWALTRQVLYHCCILLKIAMILPHFLCGIFL